MASGKSTLALQTAFNLRNSGVDPVLLTMNDRSGTGISSRIGISSDAVVINEETDLFEAVAMSLARVAICDEAQFYAPEQVDQLASVVDSLDVDVYAYGLLTDFQSNLFPGTKRLLELADRRFDLQVESRCWCGERATQNARVINGWMTLEGDQVMVGDTGSLEVGYELLCRRHFIQKHTKTGIISG